ncbi:MAG: hypothetical protein WBB82_12720, partial [Limnothrix sp.]
PPYLHYSVVSAAGELLKIQPVDLPVFPLAIPSLLSFSIPFARALLKCDQYCSNFGSPERFVLQRLC